MNNTNFFGRMFNNSKTKPANDADTTGEHDFEDPETINTGYFKPGYKQNSKEKVDDAEQPSNENINKLDKHWVTKELAKKCVEARKDGEIDGALGVPKELFDTYAQSEATYLKNKFESLINAQKIETEVAIEIEEKKVKDAENRLSYYRKIQKDSFKQPRYYSITGIFYILLGIVLNFADIPISLVTLKKGLHIEGPTLNNANSITKLFLLPKDDTGGLWEHVKNVLLANWELILLAVGISICSVFVKIFYDRLFMADFIKKIGLDKTTEDKAAEEQFAQKTIKEKLIFYFNNIDALSIMNIIIMMVFIGLMISLAIFRFTYSSDLVANGDYTIAKITFVFLSLLFPVISGVLYSVGATKLNYLIVLYRIKIFKLTPALEEFETYTEKLETHRNEKIHFANLETWIKADNLINEVTNVLKANYSIGYNRGVMASPGGKLFVPGAYERMDRFRNKVISQNIFARDKIKHPIDINNIPPSINLQ